MTAKACHRSYLSVPTFIFYVLKDVFVGKTSDLLISLVVQFSLLRSYLFINLIYQILWSVFTSVTAGCTLADKTNIQVCMFVL